MRKGDFNYSNTCKLKKDTGVRHIIEVDLFKEFHKAIQGKVIIAVTTPAITHSYYISQSDKY